jgi:hypothetical protein
MRIVLDALLGTETIRGIVVGGTPSASAHVDETEPPLTHIETVMPPARARP